MSSLVSDSRAVEQSRTGLGGYIENFAPPYQELSLQELDVQLPQVCAVVGPNNAGKSNILEGIRRVLGASWLSVNNFSEDDIYYRDPDRDIEIWCTVEPPVPYQKFKGAPVTGIHTLYFQYTKYKSANRKASHVWNRSAWTTRMMR